MIGIKHKMKVLLIVAVLLAYTVAIVGCTQKENASSASDGTGKPVIAVSIVPEDTFVKAVAGDLVDTIVMIPPGYSPANYAPSPQEMQKLSKAAIYFAIGVPAETANIIPGLSDLNENIKVIDLAGEVAGIYPDREFAPGKRDPHIWMSPKRVQTMVTAIARELSAIDPQNKDIYTANAQKYNEEIEGLDIEIKHSLKELPGKTFIVYHPSFGYFADDYGLKMIAIEEEGKAATANSIQNIIDTAKKENIKVIFYQASITSKQADAIAEEIAGQTIQVDPLASDYLDNLKKTARVFTDVLK